MNKLPKEKRDRIIVIVLGAAVVIAALWFLMITPMRASLEGLAKRTIEAQAKVERGRKSVSTAEQMAQDVAAARRELEEAESAMASGDLYSWMIQTMNRFKPAYAVDIPEISREIPCEVGVFSGYPYKAAAFRMHGETFYHEFGTFLADLENKFPYMRVQNLELAASAGPKKEHPDRLQFKMELVTLVKPISL